MRKILLLFLVFLTSCYDSPQISTILEDTSFPPITWQKITIGETTKQEMINNLYSIPFVVDDSIIEIGPWNIFDDTVDFTMFPNLLNQPATWVDTYINKNIVVGMTFCGNLDASLRDMINLFGDPDLVVITHTREIGGHTINFIHQEIGVNYWFLTKNNPEKRRVELYPEIKIGCLNYFDPSLFNEMLEAELFFVGDHNRDDPSSNIYLWNGYGNINKKYIDREP